MDGTIYVAVRTGKTIHIPLDESDLPGQWVDVRDPRFLSKRTIDRWQRDVSGGDFTPEKFLREFVVAWHLVDADTGEEMNSPTADSIDGIPIVVFQVLNERVGQLFRNTLAAGAGGPADGSIPDGDPRSAPSAT